MGRRCGVRRTPRSLPDLPKPASRRVLSDDYPYGLASRPKAHPNAVQPRRKSESPPFFDTGLTAKEGATTTSFAPLPYHPSVLPPFSGPSSRPVSNCLLNRIFGRRGWTPPGSWRSARLAPWTSPCPSEPRTVVRSLRSVACRASSPLLPRALASNRKWLSPSFYMLKRDVSFPSLPTSYGLRVRDGARTTVRTESPRRTDRSSDLAAAVERTFGNAPRKGLDCG
jgi:hypothetical protein